MILILPVYILYFFVKRLNLKPMEKLLYVSAFFK